MSGAGVPVWEPPASALASSERMREYSRRSLICRSTPGFNERLTITTLSLRNQKGLFQRNSLRACLKSRIRPCTLLKATHGLTECIRATAAYKVNAVLAAGNGTLVTCIMYKPEQSSMLLLQLEKSGGCGSDIQGGANSRYMGKDSRVNKPLDGSC